MIQVTSIFAGSPFLQTFRCCLRSYTLAKYVTFRRRYISRSLLLSTQHSKSYHIVLGSILLNAMSTSLNPKLLSVPVLLITFCRSQLLEITVNIDLQNNLTKCKRFKSNKTESASGCAWLPNMEKYFQCAKSIF